MLAAVFSIYAIYILRLDKDLPKAAKIATITLMLFLILFTYSNGSSNYGLIWTIFLPIFAFLVNGRKMGLLFSLIFYIFIYFMAFNAIGIWEDGSWQMQNFLRLFFSSIILTYIMYMNESLLEDSDSKLIEIRKREKEHIDNLHALTITDPLTELYNRRYFNVMAPKLISLAKRKKHSFTFFILDLDHFKQYNDNYGHIKGDDALREISKVLKNHIQRDDDFIFRLGGEEFAGIILSDNTKETQEWIKNICKIIENLKIEHNYSSASKYITASIGVACTDDDRYLDIDKLYAFADEALYAAKESGKNRVKFSAKYTGGDKTLFDFY
ncbi:MAG: GGDEF domain-containing protein [Sulfurimonas sp.]|nr:GGDEF domain-containing protein [Sulfurimonas sp.]